MNISKCGVCGNIIKRRGKRVGRFCSMKCKAQFQKQQRPVSEEWLRQKYVSDNLSTYQIAKLVKRDPKRVYDWLVDFGIPTRERAWSVEPNTSILYQNKDWLYQEYVGNHRSAPEIAKECGVTEGNIYHFLSKFSIQIRDMSDARKIKHWGLSGVLNGMFGKRGQESSNWKGGQTPERQSFYSSIEWKKVSRLVGKRDKGVCQRCNKVCRGDRDSHIHHIVSFQNKELRADPDNLITLCKVCHNWVHSNENINNDFIR